MIHLCEVESSYRGIQYIMANPRFVFPTASDVDFAMVTWNVVQVMKIVTTHQDSFGNLEYTLL